MGEKILYVLGAGASAQALPVVKSKVFAPNGPISLSAAMRNMAETIKQNPGALVRRHTQEPFYSKIAEDLIWLANEGERYTTIDTYAKYLFIKDGKKYDRLKFVLSVYFTLEQIHKGKLDNRYLVWLTSIMNRDAFPDNVKVITWNYDFQIELTAEHFKTEAFSYSAGGITAHSGPLISYYPALGRNGIRDYGDYSLLHLNGIAGFYQGNGDMNYHAFLNHEGNNDRNYLDRFIDCEGFSRLHFAWEKGVQSHNVKILEEMVKDVTIMVVIGYSFPFFNREMDMEVYRALVQKGKLKKIYFQDPNRNGNFLRSQFGYNPNFPIEHVPDTESLYIPFEL